MFGGIFRKKKANRGRGKKRYLTNRGLVRELALSAAREFGHPATRVSDKFHQRIEAKIRLIVACQALGNIKKKTIY
jgi:hypothetical protein